MITSVEKKTVVQAAIKPIPLTFPAHWSHQPHLHPHAAEITEEVIRWLIEGGVIQEGDSLYQIAREIRPGEFVGYSFPSAPYDRALDIGKLWTAELLWDEIDVETSHQTQSISQQEIFDLFLLKPDFDFTTPLFAQNTPFTRLMRLMRAILVTMQSKHGDDFIQHNAKEMYIWYQAAKREQIMAEQFQNKDFSFTAEEFFTNRCITVGSTLGMSIEYAYNYHMPAEFHSEPHIVEIKDLAAALVALGNDICSLGKDQKSYWPGNISVRMVLEDLTLEESIERVVREYTTYCHSFDQKSRQIANDLAFMQKYPLAEQFIQHMRFYTSGLPLWETNAERYTKIRLYRDGHIFIPIVNFVDYRSAISRAAEPQKGTRVKEYHRGF